MEEILYDGPANFTADSVDSVNDAIKRGKPTEEVLRLALIGIYGVLGQIEDMAKKTRDRVDILSGDTPEKRNAEIESNYQQLMKDLRADGNESGDGGPN